MTAQLQPHRQRQGVVFEDVQNEERATAARVAATTVIPYNEPRDGLAIVVGYAAKTQLFLGTRVQGITTSTVTARTSFFLFHQTPETQENDANAHQQQQQQQQEQRKIASGQAGPSNQPTAPYPPRMIRLISVEDSSNEPLLH